MSWSAYTVGLDTNIGDRVDALEPVGEGTIEREDQVKAAKAGAKALISSGALGQSEAYSVSLSGHSSQDHKGGIDCVNIGVSQSTAATVTAYDTQQAANLAAEQ